MRAQMMRLASYRIHQSLVEKPVSIEDYWPLASDGEKEIQEPISIDADMLAKIKRIHKLK